MHRASRSGLVAKVYVACVCVCSASACVNWSSSESVCVCVFVRSSSTQSSSRARTTHQRRDATRRFIIHTQHTHRAQSVWAVRVRACARAELLARSAPAKIRSRCDCFSRVRDLAAVKRSLEHDSSVCSVTIHATTSTARTHSRFFNAASRISSEIELAGQLA